VPKIHYSTQASQQRPGAHAAYVDAEEFTRFLQLAPPEIEFDCMLEAKAKDQALFRLRAALPAGVTSWA
jgi:UV DNA damage repair endonuclease